MTRLRKKRRSPEEIRSILDRLERSGQSKSAFARAEGIPLSTLAKWSARSGRKTGRRSVRSRIRRLASLAPASSGLEIVLPQGHRVIVPAATSEAEFEVVLRAVLTCSV